jgi:peptidoglycan/LPS O-acetylase OafA/YrhL
MAVVEKPRFFPHIEGLRGIAALYVFLFHLTQVAIGARSPFHNWAPWWLPLQYGHYAVAVFIVISGFVLGAPVARTGYFDARTFARKRFRRLYPAYITALILSLPTFYFYASVVLGKHPNLSHVAVGLLAHALLIHNLSRELITYINPPMWSIGLECQIYVVFALLLVPVWRRLGVFSQLGTALIVGLAPHFLLHGALDETYPWFVALFAVGVCAASLVNDPIALP